MESNPHLKFLFGLKIMLAGGLMAPLMTDSFVQGIQFLVQEGFMKIPATQQGSGTGSNEIPVWIKNNAGWWADGSIDD